MKLSQPLKTVQEKSELKRPHYGGHIMKVKKVTDKPSKSGKPMLTLELDYGPGDYENYLKKAGDHYGREPYYIKTWIVYSEDFLESFKSKFMSFYRSNPGLFSEADLTFANFDEQRLVGCVIGAVLGKEAYTNKQGEGRFKPYLHRFYDSSDIIAGKYQDAPIKSGFVRNSNDQSDMDIPF